MKNNLVRLFWVLALLALVSAACSKAPTLEEQLVGQWQYTDPDTNIAFIFDLQTEGKLVISAEGNTLEGTYSWVDADTINLAMTFGEQSDETPADVKIDGDTLTLTIEGEAQTFTRAK
jgi:hypothetical protein